MKNLCVSVATGVISTEGVSTNASLIAGGILTSSITATGVSSLTATGTSSLTAIGVSSLTTTGTSSLTANGVSCFTATGVSCFTATGTSSLITAGTSFISSVDFERVNSMLSIISPLMEARISNCLRFGCDTTFRRDICILSTSA